MGSSDPYCQSKSNLYISRSLSIISTNLKVKHNFYHVYVSFVLQYFLNLTIENPCDPLPPPLNGAIVCDTWLYGRHCQMQCSDKYDIPRGTAGTNGGAFTGAFTCTDLVGKYMPSEVVPNCTGI
jgi:hypothetical protein